MKTLKTLHLTISLLPDLLVQGTNLPLESHVLLLLEFDKVLRNPKRFRSVSSQMGCAGAFVAYL